jgi:hypothetical protein
VAFALDVLQEGQYQWCIELLDLELTGFDVQLARSEADQELEAVSVCWRGRECS